MKIKKATFNTTYGKIFAFNRVLNVASLFGLLGLISYEFFRNYEKIDSLFESEFEILTFICIGLLIVINFISNIILCNYSMKLSHMSCALQESHNNLDRLNNDLRKQRHDFLNNLQVIHGLISMDSFTDAKDYIDHVYSDIRSISRFIKTDSPAINALLQAKITTCEDMNIPLTLDIHSTFKDDLPMPEWLVCRILANLIDNAIDAITEKGTGHLHIILNEDVNCHYITVKDNGISISDTTYHQMFNAGFTTKGSKGTGMGLAICKDLLGEYNGTIKLDRNEEYKIFNIKIPKVISQ